MSRKMIALITAAAILGGVAAGLWVTGMRRSVDAPLPSPAETTDLATGERPAGAREEGVDSQVATGRQGARYGEVAEVEPDMEPRPPVLQPGRYAEIDPRWWEKASSAERIPVITYDWRTAILRYDRVMLERVTMALEEEGDEAIPYLKEMAVSDSSPRVRAFATRVLGRKRNVDMEEFFLRLLQEDESEFVRGNAAWALGEIRAVGALGILGEVAANDPSEHVRQEAVEAIKKIE